MINVSKDNRKSFRGTLIPQTMQVQSSLATNKNLERTPSSDSFKPQTKDSELPQASPTASNQKYITATIVSTALSVGLGAVALVKTKKAGSLAKELAASKKTISGLNKTISENSARIENLLEKIADVSSDELKLVEEYKTSFSKKIEKITSKGTPVDAPIVDLNDPLKGAKKIFKFDEIVPLSKGMDDLTENLDVGALQRQFARNGAIRVEIEGAIGKVAGENNVSKYSIGERVLSENERKQSTNIAMKYADGLVWTNEKIARDMLQNFYDGHGHTLNGVRLNMETLSNGKIRVQIAGKGLFNPEDITVIGAGSKIENPFNAGGFGEGAKVMICKMIREGKTDNVRFRCADWSADFHAENNVLVRELNKTNQILNGNAIEFETKDKGLANALLKAMNYFNHSKNADYKGLSYASDEFGFSILKNNEFGNVYLTQRFEFGGNGNWEKSLDGINLIFKRKPDAKELKALTGYDFAINRDRTSLGLDDIKYLTHYFANRKMSDDDLIRSIVSTKHLWKNLKDDSATLSFLKGLLKEAENRKIAVDLGGAKYAYVVEYTPDTVKKYLTEKGYTLLPEEFRAIKIPSAYDIWKAMSAHNALIPTDIEAKKIALLDDAVKLITQNIDITLTKYLTNPPKKIIADEAKLYFLKLLLQELSISSEEVAKVIDVKLRKLMWSGMETTPDIMQQLLPKVNQLIANKIKEIGNNPRGVNRAEVEQLIEKLSSYSWHLDIAAKNYINSLKNLTLIEPDDVTRPKYIFDRTKELAQDTLGEAIIDKKPGSGYGKEIRKYLGHWVDRGYFKDAKFNEILATWLHEIYHKSGGDGSEEFTYALTNLIEVLLAANPSKKCAAKLTAINQLYDELLEQGKKIAA